MQHSKEPVGWLLWTLFSTCLAMLLSIWYIVLPLFVAGISISIKVLIEKHIY